eukprot:TRINITY_DN1093_c0_g1_i11.p1 TRINITY_DN1093_c0_g1~~TRINITY_DN1093_c0_g1_i11.p1  ORF type:complete len:161 (-),score=29.00 TRINITY_DN1093_c0_g1_i11:499-981(-)
MFLPGLFGLEFEGMDGQYWLNKGCDVSHNLVFADGENQFWDMVQQLQHKKRSGVAVTAQSHLHVLPNEFWGLEGGTQVEVCWVYLEAVPEWHQHLPQDVRDLLSDPDEDLFQNFPHYSTVHQNSGFSLLQLTMEQVNLLSHLCSWVCEQGGILDFVGETN